MLEIDHEPTENTAIIKATEVSIELQNPQTEIQRTADIAKIVLGEDDSNYILNKVREFPWPSLDLYDRSSDNFMAIHYSGGNFKKVSTGKREAIPGNPLPLETRIHIQGGEGASGPPLFNFQGDVVAIVRSCAKNNPEIRNITPVQSSSSYGYGLRDGFENLFE